MVEKNTEQVISELEKENAALKQQVSELIEQKREILKGSKVLLLRLLQWHIFFDESIRLYGDTEKMNFEKCLRKARSILFEECYGRAFDMLYPKEDSNQTKDDSGFDFKRFEYYVDHLNRKAFSNTHVYTQKAYSDYCFALFEISNNEPIDQFEFEFMDKVKALEKIKVKYGYSKKLSSFIKLLESHDEYKLLPARRSVENLK